MGGYVKQPYRDGATATVPRSSDCLALSPADVQRLTLFKWRYALEAQGFNAPECAHLIFLRWLYGRRPRRVR